MSEDYVNHPSHYTCGKKECIDVIKDSLTSEQYAGYLMGTQIKYIYRYKNKWNPREDLDKTDWYLDKFISDCTKLKHKKLSKEKKHKCQDIRNYPPEISLQKYISALTSGKKSVLKCKKYLSIFKENLKDDNACDAEDADSTDDYSSILDGVKEGMNSIFSKYNHMVKPISQNSDKTSLRNDNCLYDDPHVAQKVFDSLKFLSKNYPELWDNAYSFEYKPSDDHVYVHSSFSGDKTNLDNYSYEAKKVFDSLKFLSRHYPELWNNADSFRYDPSDDHVYVYSSFDEDSIPITVSLHYGTTCNWSITISTENI